MFTFVRVVVEPGVRTATVAWEAPAKTIAGVVYLLLSGDISIAGSVAAAVITATDCRYLVLQQQMLSLLLLLLPLLLWASQQQKEVVVHQSGRKPSERAVDVAKLCE